MKKTICALLTVLLLSAYFSGCTGSAPDSSDQAAEPIQSASESTESAAADSGAVGEPISMRYSWWGTDARHEATIAAIEAYQNLNQEVTIEPEYGQFDAMLEKLYVQLASKTAPDIISCDIKWVFDMIRNYQDSFVNIQDTSIDLSEFDSDFINKTCGTPEFTLGAPTSITYQFTTYNPEFFTKFGLEEFGDVNDWDWETLSKAGAKVTAQDPNSHLMYTYKAGWVYFMKMFYKQYSGMDMVSEDYTVNFTVDDGVQYFNYLKELVENGTVASFEEIVPFDQEYVYQNPGWIEGRFGLGIQAASHLPSIGSTSPFTAKVAMPMVRKDAVDAGWPVSTSMILCVYSYGHPEEAAKFINWHLNSDDAIKILSDKRGLPASAKAQKLLADEGIIMPEMLQANDLFFAMSDKVHPGVVSAENGSVIDSGVSDLICEFTQQVGYGRMTPEDAAQGLVDELTAYCATK